MAPPSVSGGSGFRWADSDVENQGSEPHTGGVNSRQINHGPATATVCRLHRPAGRLRRGLMVPGFLAMAAMGSATGPVVELYRGQTAGVTTTLTQEGWQQASTDFTSNFFTAGDGVTLFDSRYRTTLAAGWATHGTITGNQIHPGAPVLDALTGFSVNFQLAVDAEDHSLADDVNADGLTDRAGFTVIVLASDGRGICLNFWKNRIWASGDDAQGGILLAQAEGVAQDGAEMAELRPYRLTMYREAWKLTAGGPVLLHGPRRDYRSHPGIRLPSGAVLNPFNKPNIIAPGDGSLEASAAVRIGPVSVETCFEPESTLTVSPRMEADQFHLEWSSTPGRRYQVEWWSAEGNVWQPGPEQTADFFFTRSGPVTPAGSGFARVRLLTP